MFGWILKPSLEVREKLILVLISWVVFAWIYYLYEDDFEEEISHPTDLQTVMSAMYHSALVQSSTNQLNPLNSRGQVICTLQLVLMVMVMMA